MPDTQEREIELVAGTIGGITQKKADTWTVAVTPEGSQYAKNLWTKDADLVVALGAKLGEHGAFVCGASHWTTQDGKNVRSLWIDSVADGTENLPERVATPAAAPAPRNVTGEKALALDTPAANLGGLPSSGGMTPEKWDAKERRDYRSRAWAQTLGAFTHTIKVDESPADVFARLQPFQRKVYEDVCGMFAYDPSLDDVPFG